MKIRIIASSSYQYREVIEERKSLDQVLQDIRCDKKFIEGIIDKDVSGLYNEHTKKVKIPNEFVITFDPCKEYDVTVEIYDMLRE